MIAFGEGDGEEPLGGFAVVVDPEWRVGVTPGRGLPGAAVVGDETPEQAMLRGLRAAGVEVEVVACLGQARDRGVRVSTYWVCRTTTPGSLEWWRGSVAVQGLALESERWVTRRALGPC